MSNAPIVFTARTIKGSGRGKNIGYPTINLDRADVPKNLAHGIYACFVTMLESNKRINESTNQRYAGALHYGPRPVFRDAVSCEVHLIGNVPQQIPAMIIVTIVQRLRGVCDFPSTEELKAQIAKDILEARAILGVS